MSDHTTEITCDELRQRFHYDPTTGTFTRRRDGKVMGVKAGHYGRIQIDLGSQMRYASRLAWLYVYGEWPTGEVDHINGNRTDNRIENLRDVTRTGNARNLRAPAPTKRSGLPGTRSTKKISQILAMLSAGLPVHL